MALNVKDILPKIFSEAEKGNLTAFEDAYHMCLEAKKTDTRLAREFLRRLSDMIERDIPNAKDDKTIVTLFNLHKKVLLAAAPIDFESFLLYVEWNRDPEKKFYVPRRKVLARLVRAMQALVDDELDLLTISMPPGTGKSTLGIFFLSWVMGRDPDGQSLASAHSGTLTRSFYDGVMQIITDPEYLWADVFPGVNVASTNSKEETIDLGKKHRFSTLTCRAINASLTGATRCDKILYADDLCSGIEEAMSKERLDKLWLSYTNDLKSRKKMTAKEIHIATRWSVHDVIGRLEQEYGDDPRAEFIALPALDENGKSNFDYGYGVGFDDKYFEDMKNNLDDASFKALFMNQPIEREGLLYNVDELRRFFYLPDSEPDAILGVCDTKDKGTDFACLPVGYQYGNDYYFPDTICDNGLPNIVDARLIDILLRHKVHLCRFESNSAGGRVAEKVQEGVKAKGGRTKITTKFTTANKETKIIVNSAWVKEHCLFLDESMYSRNSDYGKFMDMLCSYTVAGKNKHDDPPDVMAMFSEFAQSLTGSKVEIFARPW
jgi:predicted phage terminase large subunit-like protein